MATQPETTVEDCARVLAQYPNLTANGFSYRSRDGQVVAGGRIDSDGTRAEIDAARQFLRECCSQTKTIRPHTSSYGLKHEAERWISRYVSNGAFIAAAVLEGYRLERCRNGPNCFFALASTRQYRAHRDNHLSRRGSERRPENWVRT